MDAAFQLYLEGKSLAESSTPDFVKAYHLYWQAARAGCPRAVRALHNGSHVFPVPDNYRDTLLAELTSLATCQSPGDALLCLGQGYIEGWFPVLDRSLGLTYVKQAATAGKSGGVYEYAQSLAADLYMRPQIRYRLLLIAAEAGHLDAMYALAAVYEQGQAEGVARNLVKAFSLYKQMADAGDSRGIAMTAKCYAEGLGVAKDFDLALGPLQAAAKAGHIPSMYILSQHASEFPGATRRKRDLQEWALAAAKAGSADAMLYLGEGIVLEGVSPGEKWFPDEPVKEIGLQWFVHAADKGGDDVCAKILQVADRIRGMEPSEQTAFDDVPALLEKIAFGAAKTAGAALAIARYYQQDDRRTREREALEWYERAASLGSVDALYHLSRSCSHYPDHQLRMVRCLGWGVHHSFEGETGRACKLYVGEGCLEGWFGAVNAEEGFRLIAEAIRPDSASYSLVCDVAERQARKTDVAPTDKRAHDKLVFRLYNLAAEMGSATAAFRLYECFSQGRGTEANPGAALRWCKQAAQKWQFDALLATARGFEGHAGTAKDQAMAVHWYELACQAGCVAAMYHLDERAAAYPGHEERKSKLQAWAEAAADLLDPAAMLFLYFGHMGGRFGPINIDRALEWYKRAHAVPSSSSSLKRADAAR